MTAGELVNSVSASEALVFLVVFAAVILATDAFGLGKRPRRRWRGKPWRSGRVLPFARPGAAALREPKRSMPLSSCGW